MVIKLCDPVNCSSNLFRFYVLSCICSTTYFFSEKWCLKMGYLVKIFSKLNSFGMLHFLKNINEVKVYKMNAVFWVGQKNATHWLSTHIEIFAQNKVTWSHRWGGTFSMKNMNKSIEITDSGFELIAFKPWTV